jgi:hypothetical protein
MQQPDILGGHPLPNCPYKGSYLPPYNTSTTRYYNPAISSTYYMLFFAFLLFGLTTIFKYNKVKIFNRSITHPSITNKEYIGLFLITGISFLIDGIRYSTDLPFQHPPDAAIRNNTSRDEQWVVGSYVIDAWLLVGSSLLRTVGLMFLTLALNQQRLYRSKGTIY